MSNTSSDTEQKKVYCEACLKEIPLDEAISAEAADYIAYFCGLECYAHWKEQVGDKSQTTPT